jgi:uncharacterized Zn finger protein
MPSITINCPECRGPTVPRLVLRQWAIRRYVQCLACNTVWRADIERLAVDRWEASLARVASEDYPFDYRPRTPGLELGPSGPELYF